MMPNMTPKMTLLKLDIEFDTRVKNVLLFLDAKLFYFVYIHVYT